MVVSFVKTQTHVAGAIDIDERDNTVWVKKGHLLGNGTSHQLPAQDRLLLAHDIWQGGDIFPPLKHQERDILLLLGLLVTHFLWRRCLPGPVIFLDVQQRTCLSQRCDKAADMPGDRLPVQQGAVQPPSSPAPPFPAATCTEFRTHKSHLYRLCMQQHCMLALVF
jgi:hypothetical protein